MAAVINTNSLEDFSLITVLPIHNCSQPNKFKKSSLLFNFNIKLIFFHQTLLFIFEKMTKWVSKELQKQKCKEKNCGHRKSW